MEQIYRKYAQYVYKYLMSLCHDTFVAEELTQETFYQAIKSLPKFDERSKLSTWLVGIARNQYLIYLRKNPNHENVMDMYETIADDRTPEAETLQKLSRVRVLKLLHNCPEPYREVLYLRMFEDLSFRDIGEIMGKTENWARVNYYRGKEKLKTLYLNESYQ